MLGRGNLSSCGHRGIRDADCEPERNNRCKTSSYCAAVSSPPFILAVEDSIPRPLALAEVRQLKLEGLSDSGYDRAKACPSRSAREVQQGQGEAGAAQPPCWRVP